MNRDEWEKMTPEEQANAWWRELSAMIRDAMASIQYTSGNAETEVTSGLTTVVAMRDQR